MDNEFTMVAKTMFGLEEVLAKEIEENDTHSQEKQSSWSEVRF